MRFLLIVLLAGSVNAEETCCVDKDIAAAFMLHATYSRDWPDSFPIKLNIPDLELIGSSTAQSGRHTSVAWKSQLNPQGARLLVANALIRDDWVAMPQNESMQARFQRGFVPYQPIVIGNNQQFCRDRKGSLNIQARLSDIGTVVTLSHYARSGVRDCEAMIAAQRIRPGYQSGISSYLPALTLPESIRMPYEGLGSGGGGSDGAHASASVETSISPSELMTSFDKQMVTQEWQMDTSFQGIATSGHIWHRNVDGLKLVCILTAFASGDDKVRLRMHVEPLQGH